MGRARLVARAGARLDRKLAPRGDVELAVDVAEVGFGRLHRHEQCLGGQVVGRDLRAEEGAEATVDGGVGAARLRRPLPRRQFRRLCGPKAGGVDDDAAAIADDILARCGDVEPEECRRDAMEEEAGSLSRDFFLDVCHALVEKTGEDPARCLDE